MGELLDFIGWDGLSVADQIAVAFYTAVGGVCGFILAMWLLALFGFSPRRAPVPAKAKAKPKASAKRKPPAKAKRKGGR